MKSARKIEKRLYPRIEHRLPIKVAVNGYNFITSTHNISCIGAYCRVNKYMPPFTRVLVKLDLPMRNGREKHCPLECTGVVVRTEDEATGGFNIAIFFNRITEEQRKKISQYLNQILSPELCLAKTA